MTALILGLIRCVIVRHRRNRSALGTPLGASRKRVDHHEQDSKSSNEYDEKADPLSTSPTRTVEQLSTVDTSYRGQRTTAARLRETIVPLAYPLNSSLSKDEVKRHTRECLITAHASGIPLDTPSALQFSVLKIDLSSALTTAYPLG